MKIKKIIAAFLAAAMAISSAAIPVFADENAPEIAPEEAPIETVEEAVEAPEEIADEPTVEAPVEDEIELAEESAAPEATQCPWEGSGDSEDDPYLIKTADDLRDLANAVNNQPNGQVRMFKNKYFKMTQDIDLGLDNKWVPIGTGISKAGYFKAFCGTFDGAEHAIKNLRIDRTDSCNGIFGFIRDGAVIKNLSVRGSINGGADTGGIVGLVYDKCLISNCHNYCEIHCGGSSGGIVGHIGDGEQTEVIDCHNEGAITTTSSKHVGGIVGEIYYSGPKITNCYNTGTITKQKPSRNGEGLGGIVGYGKGIIITKCYNAGEITGPDSAIGGIVGYGNAGMEIDGCYNTAKIEETAGGDITSSVGGIIGEGNGVYKIANCYNEGQIIGAGTNVGGIAGKVTGSNSPTKPIENCENSAPVNGATNVGGIAGQAGELYVRYCSNSGKVSGTGDYVGGIYGKDISRSCHTIGCYNTADVTGVKYVGGIGGALANNGSSIQHSYNLGSVTGTGEYVGGIVGDDNSLKTTSGVLSDNISYCFNAGKVTTGDGNTPGGVLGTGQLKGQANQNVVTNTFYKTGTAEHGYVADVAEDVDGQIQVFGTYSDLKGKLPSSEWYFEADENEPPQLVKNPRPSVVIDCNSGGKATAEKAEDGTVTVTVTPNGGYVLAGIKAECNGEEFELTGKGPYTFKMPNKTVYITVTFMKENTHTIVDAPIVDTPKVNTGVFGETTVPPDAFSGWSAELSDMSDLNALGDAINKNDDLYDKAKEQLTKEGEAPPTDVYIHVVTDLELTVENYDSATNTLTVDVSAIRHILASTEKTLTDEQLEHPGTNVVEIIPEHVIPINNKVTIVLPLPETLYGTKVPSVDVRHIHNNKATKQTVDNINNSATVTVDGLSEFMISPTALTPPSWEVIAGDQTVTAESSGDSTIKVPNNITSATITGKNITATVNGEEVTFTDRADVKLQPGDNVITVTADGTTYTITITRAELKSMSVYFKQSGSDKHKYDIILKAGNGKIGDSAEQTDGIINRLNSADLTFELTPEESDVSYTITPADKIGIIDAGGGRYEFNFSTKDDIGEADTQNEIVIGTVEFFGRGHVTRFGVKALSGGEDTNAVHPTTGGDNLVTDYTPGGTHGGTLNINAEDFSDIYGNEYKGRLDNLDFSPAKKPLKINVMFPNTVERQDADYTNMTISFRSPLDSIEKIADIRLGDAAAYNADSETGFKQYSVAADVIADTRYTITFTGEGYREYSVDVIVPESANGENSVTVWNNVMDKENAKAVVNISGTESELKDITFLAGDIDNSQKIDLYDLSAAVAYFGRTDMAETAASIEENKEYIRYDLNRDGTIDSKDIAMVLVSWDK